jgi:hypothetical protein
LTVDIRHKGHRGGDRSDQTCERSPPQGIAHPFDPCLFGCLSS